jgi:hypothetical protein
MKASEFFDQIPAYLDGTLGEREKIDFEHVLQSNTALKRQVEEFQEMEAALRSDKLQQPSRNFTQRVMGNLENYPLQSRSSIFNGLLLLGGVIILVSLCILLSYTGFFDSAQSQIDLNNISMVNKYFKQSLPAIPFNGKLVVNIIIFLNLVLALIVFDRAVLKPIFLRRMQTGS